MAHSALGALRLVLSGTMLIMQSCRPRLVCPCYECSPDSDPKYAGKGWFIYATSDKTNTRQTRNQQLLDGSVTPFEIVPFTDGSMPTDVATVSSLAPYS
jgi:hypothetical protein